MEGDVPGRLVGQGKLWTQHPSGPGSPRAARDCASRLERDAGTVVTAKYAMHISSLLAKPHVIARPSYVQLKEAFSPAGTKKFSNLDDTDRPCWIPALAVRNTRALCATRHDCTRRRATQSRSRGGRHHDNWNRKLAC